MSIGSAMCDLGNPGLMALTAIERWAAVRRVTPDVGRTYTPILVMGLLLLVLLMLLLWVHSRRPATEPRQRRDLFLEGAMRRGLGPRERHILLAIAARDRLRTAHDIFTSPEAFDRGAARLLAECAPVRTPEENTALREEVSRLRERLGYRRPVSQGGVRASSSQNVPVGGTVELSRSEGQEGHAIEARVVRNDDLEIVVESQTPIETEAGRSWRVRYHLDDTVWEFQASAVRGEGRRLILNHSEQVHVAERSRARQIAVNAPAVVARFPFVRGDGESAGASVQGTQGGWLELVQAVVTHVEGPNLQIRSPLHPRPGERLLVLFSLERPVTEGGQAAGTSHPGQVVGHIARVTHGQAAGDEMLITAEMIGLAETEIDTLVRLANAAAARTGHNQDEGAAARTPAMQGV